MGSPNSEITLRELAKISLGASKLTKDHLSILQIVLTAIMNKLGCENEIVRLSGISGQCLKGLLQKSQEPQMQVKFPNIGNFQNKYKHLAELEARLESIQRKMANHYEEIRKRSADSKFLPKIWDKYALPTEDLCTLYSEENKDFCIMARNSTFNKAMRQRFTEPVLRRMEEFEQQIGNMSQQLKAINDKADEVAAKLKHVPPLIGQIEKNRSAIGTQWQTVRDAMAELHAMLNCKLERIALPALRKYLENQFAVVKKHLNLFKKSTNKCAAVSLIDVPALNVCLSCMPSSDIKPLPILNLTIPIAHRCGCESTRRELTILQKMDKIRVKSYRVIAMPITSALNVYDETNASTISQKLRAQGHYIQSYTTYNKYRFRDAMDLKPLITVAEGSVRKSSSRRTRSFNPIKSLTFIGQGSRSSRNMPHLPISRMKSKLTLTERKPSDLSVTGYPKRRMSSDNARNRTEPWDDRPVTISSVNFIYDGFNK